MLASGTPGDATLRRQVSPGDATNASARYDSGSNKSQQQCHKVQYAHTPDSLESPHGDQPDLMPRTTIARLILAAMLAALPAPRALSGQAVDPRAAFLDALGQFSLALDGTFGDEGPHLSASL